MLSTSAIVLLQTLIMSTILVDVQGHNALDHPTNPNYAEDITFNLEEYYYLHDAHDLEYLIY